VHQPASREIARGKAGEQALARPSALRKVFLSLGVRVAVPIVLLLLSVAALAYLGLSRQARVGLLNSKEVAAEMVVKLTSVSVMPAVVFGDQQEMQRAVNDLARNPDVSDVELWGFESSALGASEGLLAQFHRAGGHALGRPNARGSQRFRDGDAVRIVEPVLNLENKRVAALTARFSTEREAATLAQLSRQILIVSAATATSLALAILLLIRHVVVAPVEKLGRAAERLARGEAPEAKDAAARREDEVGRLERQFENMAEAVRDREQQLGVRNAELKLILDSVDQGFVTARLDGTLLEERSAIVEQWVGPLPPNATVWALVGMLDPQATSWTQIAWSQLQEDMLPAEVAIDQLPKRIERNGQHFSLRYHPVMLGDAVEQVVIVITDVTSEVERQRALAEQNELALLIDHFVRDRPAFRNFWDEAERLVTAIVDSSTGKPDELRRDIHTLKGNARYFGLNRLSEQCHELESAMANRDTPVLNERERAGLRQSWDALRQRLEPLLKGPGAFVEISRDEYQRLREAATRLGGGSELSELVRGLRRDPVKPRLERAQQALIETCKKLGKAPPEVSISHDDLRLPPEVWAPFWGALVHLLNNTADHGLEPDDRRRQQGKPVPGKVSLSFRRTATELVFELRDDGRGVDWKRVRELAVAKGLRHETPEDLRDALFADGFTLKDEVSRISGRGVGLGAVRQVLDKLRAQIELDSREGKGTSWCFRFPLTSIFESDSEQFESDSHTPKPDSTLSA
jgi:HPt (histidine-containing phosphotransfer) domain-containing protein/HAMP domain-containing protein